MIHKIATISMALALCLSATVKTNAQGAPADPKQEQKGYIGITGGGALLFGNFTQTGYNDDKAGFASSGMNIGITGVYFIKHHFGIAALVSYHGYGYHGAQNLVDGYKEAFDLDSATLYRKGNNQSFNILVGPYYSLPLGNGRLHLDARVLAGYVNAQFAGNEIYLEDGVGNQFEQKPATASAFGYQAGLGLRYDLGHFDIGINADYFGANPHFTIDNTNRKNEAGWKRTEYAQPIQGVNANLTLLYHF